MQTVLVIRSMDKRQALKVFRSSPVLISYCWNFPFTSSRGDD